MTRRESRRPQPVETFAATPDSWQRQMEALKHDADLRTAVPLLRYKAAINEAKEGLLVPPSALPPVWGPPLAPPRREPSEPALPIENLLALRVGETIEGGPWNMPLWGVHLFIAGLTGWGKTRFIYSLIHSAAPFIRDRRVRLCGLDPKQVGLAPMRPLFTPGCLWTPRNEGTKDFGAGAAALLEQAVEEMKRRLNVMEDRGETEHTPTVAEPLIVIIIDEIARLGLVTNKDIKQRIADAIGMIIQMGRAPGVALIVATQDPRIQDLLKNRDLIPVRVGFRLASSDQIDMVLGPGAYKNGANCHEIRNRGEAWVLMDDDPEPRLVRSHMVTNEELRTMAYEYAPA